MDSFKQIQQLWYQKLKEVGFEDIEKPNGELRVEIHPHYKRLAFEEAQFRQAYTSFASSVLWEFPFEKEIHRTIWEMHTEGIPIRRIGDNLLLTRNQVWPVINRIRAKARTMKMEQFKTRPYKDNDRDLIIASWLNSYKHSSEFAKRIKHSIYYHWHNLIVNNLLDKSNITVACLPDEEDAILGYIVSQKQDTQRVVHYLFVKDEWRDIGIARALFNTIDEGHPIYFTHWTAPVNSLFDKLNLIYDPYRI